jgi:hypothetical protein
LILSIAHLDQLKEWHKKMARQHARKAKNLVDKLTKLEDIELTAEEIAEDKQETAEYIQRLQLGEGVDPSLESPNQAFMNGCDVRIEEEQAVAVVDPVLLEGEQIVTRLIDERVRYGFDITVSQVTVAVEKVIVKDVDSSTRIISASTRDLGPAKMDVTWEFLANMMIMVAQYAMPFNRLAALLSSPVKRFTSSSLSRKFGYAAHRFVPIYLHNFQRLADTLVLSGDDTSNQVTEYKRYMKSLPGDDVMTVANPPWKDFATPAVAEELFSRQAEPGLGVKTSRVLGFESNRKDGSGPKSGLQTTLLWGRGDPADPRSTIIFYRSHIGSFGNLATLCLGLRDPAKKNVIIQSDLAAINLVSDAALNGRFAIKHVGCGSHARRPFAIYEAVDPDSCAHMLHLFKGLYLDEKGLDIVGRNELNVRAVRDIDSRKTWEEIRELAKSLMNKWPGTSPLGTALRYIVRHFAKLTAYLENPAIALSNDFSERMLRMENLIENNSLFRTSIEGRFALDIVRSILQTAIAAQVPLQDYVAYVMRAKPADVEARPADFTALAYAKKLRDEAAAGGDEAK